MEQYERDVLKARLQLIRFLMALADKRGYTHGEKHHVIRTCQLVISDALNDLGDIAAWDHQYDSASIGSVEIADIPF